MKNIVRHAFAGIVAISAIGFASPSRADNPYVVTRDLGGRISSYDHYWHRVSSRYDRVVIDGPCKSACTMVLGIIPLDRICITSRGHFAFHAAHPTGVKGIADDRATGILRGYYPEPVKAWVDRNGALTRTTYTVMSASQANFIKKCVAPAGFKKDRELNAIVHNSDRPGRGKSVRATGGGGRSGRPYAVTHP